MPLKKTKITDITATKLRILDTIADGYSLSTAAEYGGISLYTLQQWQQDDQNFAQLCNIAKERAMDKLEDRLTELAFEGHIKALCLILAKRRPQLWDTQLDVHLSHQQPVVIVPEKCSDLSTWLQYYQNTNTTQS